MPEQTTTTTPKDSTAGAGAALERLLQIMERLLGEDGCPWDRKQTLASLRPFLIEEAHEVIEAIERGDAAGHCEELGDLLFQIVFHSALRSREGAFAMADVCEAISGKLVRRHPHVFGDLKVKDADEVLRNWGRLKHAEHKAAGKTRRVLDGVPASLPALLLAQRLGEKAAQVGFDWPDAASVREKVDEELAELDHAIATGGQAAIEHEIGDLLLTITRLAAKLGVAPEDALRAALARFQRRFEHIEDRALENKRNLMEMSLEEMNAFWQEAKHSMDAALPKK